MLVTSVETAAGAMKRAACFIGGIVVNKFVVVINGTCGEFWCDNKWCDNNNQPMMRRVKIGGEGLCNVLRAMLFGYQGVGLCVLFWKMLIAL